MTATRSIIAGLVTAALIAAGTYFWFCERYGCPDAYIAGTTYQTGDEVLFSEQVWKADAVTTTEVPGPTATDWTLSGTC